jgi:hypothetical protein
MLALLCAFHGARAQTAPLPQHDAEPVQFRVYANLLQIPVLILDPALQPVKPLDPAKFTIRFDELPPIRPRIVRLEGEDPITLAILIDHAHQNALLPGLADALATLTPDLLGPQDRVVLHETDGCHLRRHGEMRPVQRAFLLLYAMSAASSVHPDRSVEPCTEGVGLWRSIATVASSLSGEPGRRVLLVVTDGIDPGSSFTAEMARATATNAGVAIFSVAERGRIPPGHWSAASRFTVAFTAGRGLSMPAPSDLQVMSEFSGGMVLETDPRGLASTLHRFVTLVRGRYIVEFNRPVNLAGGKHILTVGIGQPRYFIRPAGTSMPTADPAQLSPGVQHGPLSSHPPDPDQLAPSTPASQTQTLQTNDPALTTTEKAGASRVPNGPKLDVEPLPHP